MNDRTDVPVEKRANLHEKAVQAVARGDVQPMRRKAATRRLKGPGEPATGVHTHIQVHPLVMSRARWILEDEDNSYSQLEIIDESTVVLR